MAPNVHRKASIEAQTLNAPAICVGKVSKIQTDQVPQNHTNCVVEIEQNVRGLGFSDKYQLFLSAPEAQLRAWMSAGSRLLIFEGRDVVDLSDPALEEYTSDGKALKKPEEVIGHVRKTIRENPGVVATQVFAFRPRLMGGKETYFTVPLDARLERWARKTLASSLISEERVEAVSALGLLENPDDVPLFKRLLLDERTVPGWRDGKRAERYGVRMAAYDALVRMGVKVPKPEEFKGG